jgi:hypothetical protein
LRADISQPSELVQQARCDGQRIGTRGSQSHRAGVALEQRNSEIRLQGTYSGRDRRLSRLATHGGPSEAAFLGHRNEVFEKAGFHDRMLSIFSIHELHEGIR